MERYAKEIGLDMSKWNACMDADTHRGRILANQAEGNRRQVQSTPTFVIGTKMFAGAMSFDQMKALVDTAEAQMVKTATARADSQVAKAAHSDSQAGSPKK
jgi:protein-disulfide isomerase